MSYMNPSLIPDFYKKCYTCRKDLDPRNFTRITKKIFGSTSVTFITHFEVECFVGCSKCRKMFAADEVEIHIKDAQQEDFVNKFMIHKRDIICSNCYKYKIEDFLYVLKNKSIYETEELFEEVMVKNDEHEKITLAAVETAWNYPDSVAYHVNVKKKDYAMQQTDLWNGFTKVNICGITAISGFTFSHEVDKLHIQFSPSGDIFNVTIGEKSRYIKFENPIFTDPLNNGLMRIISLYFSYVKDENPFEMIVSGYIIFPNFAYSLCNFLVRDTNEIYSYSITGTTYINYTISRPLVTYNHPSFYDIIPNLGLLKSIRMLS